MVCDHHLGQLAETEKALRQGKFSASEASLEEKAIMEEIRRCCP